MSIDYPLQYGILLSCEILEILPEPLCILFPVPTFSSELLEKAFSCASEKLYFSKFYSAVLIDDSVFEMFIQYIFYVTPCRSQTWRLDSRSMIHIYIYIYLISQRSYPMISIYQQKNNKKQQKALKPLLKHVLSMKLLLNM